MIFKRKKRSLKDDIQIASGWISESLISSGYQADYSMKSLKEIDRFLINENRPRGILSKNTGQKIFALGAYIGDVFIKEYGGHWVTDDKDHEGEIKIMVELDNDITFYPVISVMKCFENPNEQSLYLLGQAIQHSLE